MKRSLLVLLLSFTVNISSVYAQTDEPRVTILVPILYNGPGAFGSYWWASVVVNNHSARTFSSPGVQFRVTGQCSIPEGCPSTVVPVGEFGEVHAPQHAQGLLLYASEEIAHDLAFQARFGSGFDDLGTSSELPLVRDGEFRRGPIRLPNIALHGTPTEVRSNLRIYGPDAQPGTAVRVEIRRWDEPTGPIRAQRILHLTAPASSSPLPLFPAFAQLTLQQEFPLEATNSTIVNVTVVPLPLPNGEVPRIWAFVSTTENATQEVVIQRPQ